MIVGRWDIDVPDKMPNRTIDMFYVEADYDAALRAMHSVERILVDRSDELDARITSGDDEFRDALHAITMRDTLVNYRRFATPTDNPLFARRVYALAFALTQDVIDVYDAGEAFNAYAYMQE